MTSRTRGRLTMCFVLGLLTLPVEALLLPVARTPNLAEAAVAWAGGLSTVQLQAAGLEIDAYPPVYRRAIMRKMGPQDRSMVWRGHFQRFLRTHRQLSAEQAAVIDDAIALASDEAFTPPLAPDVKEHISALFNQSMAVLGPKQTEELFVTLGPKTLQRASALPVMQQMADRVRSWRVASAEYPDCNCNIDIDTCDLEPNPWLQCSELYTCNFDLNWPMCGPFWSWACTGWCKIIRWPSYQ
jgi:hypothetical protein